VVLNAFHLGRPGVTPSKAIIPLQTIQRRILLIRGEKVIVDADLAAFYGVPTRRLNEQVKRNRARFPADFVFRLTTEEKKEVVANCDHLTNIKYSRRLPQVFTEHGVMMAATVLNSPKAVDVSVVIVRAFVELRRAMTERGELFQKLGQLERRLADHDKQILGLIHALKKLMGPEPIPKKRRIGFRTEE